MRKTYRAATTVKDEPAQKPKFELMGALKDLEDE